MRGAIRIWLRRLSGKSQARRGLVILAALGVVSCQCVYGANGRLPVTTPFGDVVPAATMQNKPATALLAGSLRVVFNRTTLADILSHFPGGTISVNHEMGASGRYSVCYQIRSAKPTEYAWVLSDSEMGGPKHRVTEIQATTRVLSPSESAQCGDLTKKMKVVFDNGIWLGSSARQISRTLGPPSARKGHWLGYSYEKSERHTVNGKPVTFDVGNFFQVHMENGAVTEIDASEVISS